ncbi:MAG TPA: bifunctional DNA-formamidopyrimidine glycosylase/DNA-(apurinic or apyrimidinic site) lyase [Candidatus Moranbacteria bacterium]|nr:bifunctional DNA-formamidopyrimidine glycosylase/DNA-(apurinic or apyrimidinic site) lyase [Candidatus Moranbacteria bacterium]
MPELPEVETIRRGLRRKIVSKKIKKIIIKKPNLVKHSGIFFRKQLIENSFTDVQRIGKLLIFPLKKQNEKKEKQFLLIHLKMTGQLIFCNKEGFVAGGHANSKKEEQEFIEGKRKNFCCPGKYTHIIFEFNDKSELFFNDLRQFGYLKIVNEKELQEIKKSFGIEPGKRNFTWENFKKALLGKKRKIKAILLDQSIISGLGNIYVDESLFGAKIYPERIATSLTEKEKRALFVAIKRIINLALKYNGTTFSDFLDSKGKKGNFKQKLKVYGREGKKCKRKNCVGIIEKIKVSGRGTRFCPFCQK